jgi:hypothetical protein
MRKCFVIKITFLIHSEREAFLLYEKLKIDQKGEAGYRLWRDNIDKDPEAQKYIPYI